MYYIHTRIYKCLMLFHLVNLIRVPKQNFNQVDCVMSRWGLIFRI